MTDKKVQDLLEDSLIEEGKLISRGRMFLGGEIVEFGRVDNSLLREAAQKHAQAGREVMADFLDWLIQSEGFNRSAAKRIVGLVWNVRCLTNDDPAEILLHRGYSQGRLDHFRNALKHWAAYKGDSLLWSKLVRPRQGRGGGKPAREPLTPYSDEEYQALLDACDHWKGDPRVPWAWPCLRLVVRCSMRVKSELVYLERKQLRRKKGTLKVAATGKVREIPKDVAPEELDVLRRMPSRWGILADLISPLAAPDNRPDTAGARVLKMVGVLWDRAGVDPRSRVSRLRMTIAQRYYDHTGNLVGAAQVAGYRSFVRVRDVVGIREKLPSEDEPWRGGPG